MDERVPSSRDTPTSSSRESDPEPPRKVVSGGPKLQGLLAENAVAKPYLERIILVTWSQQINVLSEGCESRNNHWYAVVVQDIGTQWIQSDPCKTKTSQETKRSLQKFLESDRKPKVIYTDNTLEIGKSCEELSWNHCTSTPHRSEANGIAERAVRRIKEGTCIVAVRLGRKTVGRFHGMLPLSAKCSRSLVWREYSLRKSISRTIQRSSKSLWSNGWTLPDFDTRPSKTSSIWQGGPTGNIPGVCFVRGENLEGRHFGRRHWGAGKFGRVRNPRAKTQIKRSDIAERWR